MQAARFEVEMGEAERPKATPAGEAKTFRRYDQSQSYLLPPSLDDWLPGTTSALCLRGGRRAARPLADLLLLRIRVGRSAL